MEAINSLLDMHWGVWLVLSLVPIYVTTHDVSLYGIVAASVAVVALLFMALQSYISRKFNNRPIQLSFIEVD